MRKNRGQQRRSLMPGGWLRCRGEVTLVQRTPPRELPMPAASVESLEECGLGLLVGLSGRNDPWHLTAGCDARAGQCQ
ncbi:hypothetical protein NDU88_001554 [Pleurodeles waltl]|uniref:Uncharacterized protein n=1 Tax=Pleurodeles waltl TaxID=8319 RepID=A0AAV7MM21_PLEWA|nr:hypothetical protein NDU88_001554 [Pleurodeles waltl]